MRHALLGIVLVVVGLALAAGSRPLTLRLAGGGDAGTASPALRWGAVALGVILIVIGILSFVRVF
jgi:uncharacterized membrane protein HdeD (DUF308 family)